MMCRRANSENSDSNHTVASPASLLLVAKKDNRSYLLSFVTDGHCSYNQKSPCSCLLTETERNVKSNQQYQTKPNLECVNFKWEDLLNRFFGSRHYSALQYQNQSRQVVFLDSAIYLSDNCNFDRFRWTEHNFHLKNTQLRSIIYSSVTRTIDVNNHLMHEKDKREKQSYYTYHLCMQSPTFSRYIHDKLSILPFYLQNGANPQS